MQHPSANFATWSGLSADSNAEALDVGRLLTEYMNLLFSEGHRAWNGEKQLASVLFFFPTSSKLEGRSTGSKLPSPPRMEKSVFEFFETIAPGGKSMCRIGGTLAAVLTLVMFEAYLRPG